MPKSYLKSFIKEKIKGSTFNFLYFLGRILSLNKYPPILAYHSIDDSGSGISVSLAEFNDQMLLLKKNGYKSLDLGEFVSIIKNNGRIPPKSFILTFDDGYHNNYSIVYPLLQELGFTATIYLITGYIGGFCDWIKDIPVPKLKMLEWETILEMSGDGITFGAHTITHPHLTGLSNDQIEMEICKSRDLIKEKLGKKVTSFCYPYEDFDERVMNIVKKCDFDSACSGSLGVKNDINTLFSLKRIPIWPETTLSYFRFAFSGFYDFLIKRKKLLKQEFEN